MTKAREWTEEEKQWMKDSLSYVPDTGDLVWKEFASTYNNRRVTGSVAGTISSQGYLVISNWSTSRSKSHQFRVHRIIWFLNYGEVPRMLDHINGNRSDNRIENLRPTTHSLNGRN